MEPVNCQDCVLGFVPRFGDSSFRFSDVPEPVDVAVAEVFFTIHSFQSKFASDVVYVDWNWSTGAPPDVTEYVGKPPFIAFATAAVERSEFCDEPNAPVDEPTWIQLLVLFQSSDVVPWPTICRPIRSLPYWVSGMRVSSPFAGRH